MIKFKDVLNNTSLVFDDLNDTTKRKVDRFEDVYEAYSNAYDNEDFATSDKYESQLDKLDSELVSEIQAKYKEKNSTPPKAVEPTPTPIKVEEPIVGGSAIPNTPPKAVEPTPIEETPKEESKGFGFGFIEW
tara:strand:+ start:83 stop:478 length:396 start_codon:yes stop_codon:yes gene_type:complete